MENLFNYSRQFLRWKRHGHFLPEGKCYAAQQRNNLLGVVSIKHVNVHKSMLPTITCLSIFKIVNLSYMYVLSYVNILKYFPDTYYMERPIIAKVAVFNYDR